MNRFICCKRTTRKEDDDCDEPVQIEGCKRSVRRQSAKSYDWPAGKMESYEMEEKARDKTPEAPRTEIPQSKVQKDPTGEKFVKRALSLRQHRNGSLESSTKADIDEKRYPPDGEISEPDKCEHEDVELLCQAEVKQTMLERTGGVHSFASRHPTLTQSFNERLTTTREKIQNTSNHGNGIVPLYSRRPQTDLNHPVADHEEKQRSGNKLPVSLRLPPLKPLVCRPFSERRSLLSQIRTHQSEVGQGEDNADEPDGYLDTCSRENNHKGAKSKVFATPKRRPMSEVQPKMRKNNTLSPSMECHTGAQTLPRESGRSINTRSLLDAMRCSTDDSDDSEPSPTVPRSLKLPMDKQRLTGAMPRRDDLATRPTRGAMASSTAAAAATALASGPSPEDRFIMALFDYRACTEKDMNMKKGQILLLLDDSCPDWWYAKARGVVAQGFVPSNFVAEWHLLELEPWYFGKFGREEADRILMKSHVENGDFLIRDSDSRKHYLAMSVRNGGIVSHYLICPIQEGGFYIVPSPEAKFTSLRHFITHYTRVADGLCIRLRNPVSKEENEAYVYTESWLS